MELHVKFVVFVPPLPCKSLSRSNVVGFFAGNAGQEIWRQFSGTSGVCNKVGCSVFAYSWKLPAYG